MFPPKKKPREATEGGRVALRHQMQIHRSSTATLPLVPRSFLLLHPYFPDASASIPCTLIGWPYVLAFDVHTHTHTPPVKS